MKRNRKVQLNKRKKDKKWLLYCLSFSIGLAFFFLLIQTEKNALSDYQTKKVAIAKCNMKAGTCIKKDQLDEYFDYTDVNISYAISDISSNEQMLEWLKNGECLICCVDMKKDEQIYKERFICPEQVVAELKEPVETGIKVESYEYSVGGTLRAGDLIDVSIVNMENEAETILENVLIVQAFDMNGNEISGEKEEAVSVGFNIVVEKEQLEMYQAAVENGIVRLTKKF